MRLILLMICTLLFAPAAMAADAGPAPGPGMRGGMGPDGKMKRPWMTRMQGGAVDTVLVCQCTCGSSAKEKRNLRYQDPCDRTYNGKKCETSNGTYSRLQSCDAVYVKR